MNPSAWEDEIRAWLLGFVYRRRGVAALDRPAVAAIERLPPVLRWWLFEGHHSELLDGAIGERWDRLSRLVHQLLQTHNPGLRLEDRPTPEVDWQRTLARGPRWPPEYVCRAAAVGLGDEERAALLGWCGWLAAHWEAFRRTWQLATDAHAESLARLAERTGPVAPDDGRLSRWAHVARRSRWPLLRTLAAETLRATWDPAPLVTLPLPSEREALIELLCLVRAARIVAPGAASVRWLQRRADAGAEGATVHLPGVLFRHQHQLQREDVLRAALEPDLADAHRLFSLRAHVRPDVVARFDPPWHGFDALVMEVKSGGQPPEDAVPQVHAYARALRASGARRVLAWGLAEASAPLTRAQLDAVAAHRDAGDDVVWVFCGIDDIGPVLSRLREAG